MFINAAFTLLLLGILTSVLVTGQECGPRNISAAGGSCERACGDGGTCRQENRECVCDGLCGLSCLKKACPLLQSPVQGYVTVTPSQHDIDAVARYRCNRDFTLFGNSNRTCQSDKTWSGSEPVCRELSNSAPVLAETHHCSLLAFPTNGVVAYYEERRIEGAIATYRCDDGYTLIGNKNRTCLREGSWSGSDPDCVVVSCPDVNIQGGNVHHREVNRISREGDEITFSCNEGFQLRYPQRTTCTSGQWTQALPYCEEVVRCPSVQNPLNGQKIGHDYSYDSEVAFRCNLGYILEGANEIRCLTNGSWSAAPPTCREIRCPAPDVRSNVRSDQSLPEYPYQGTVRFYCENKFEIRGPNEITCESNGQWSNIPPICVATCVVPRRPYYGRWLDNVRDGATKSDGYGLTYTCNSGYFKCQISQLTCIDGEWMPPPESLCLLGCLIQVTQDAGISVNYSHPDGISCTNSRYKPVRTIRSFTCRRGYRIPQRAPGQSTCQSNGRLRGQSWSSPMPTCEKILCPPIAIQNGRVRYTLDARLILTLEQNTTATFTCNNGYYKSHHNSSSCDLGIWTNEPPRCIEEPCRESSINFGNWEAVYNTPESEPGSGYRLGGTIATFNCVQYGYATDVQQTCRLGSWDGQRPFCRKIPCEGENLNNGRVEYSSDRVEHGTDRSYICDDGFTLRGNGASTCDAGQWTRELPECVEDIRCPAPGNVSNGRWAYVRASANRSDPHAYILNEKVTLQCNPGYHASSNRESWCNYQGQWSPPLSSCIAD